jgi:hypothetical protein
MTPVTGGELGHDDPHHHDADRYLDVWPVADCQALIRHGEEEVEPER